MSGFKSLLIAFIVVGIFFISLIAFAITLEKDNDINNSILGDTQLNKSYQKVYNIMEDLQKDTQTKKEQFDKDSSSLAIGFFILESILSVGKGLFDTIGSLFSGISEMLYRFLPPIIIVVFSAIIIILGILGLWRLYKTGE